MPVWKPHQGGMKTKHPCDCGELSGQLTAAIIISDEVNQAGNLKNLID